jgi:hypothetical protein
MYAAAPTARGSYDEPPSFDVLTSSTLSHEATMETKPSTNNEPKADALPDLPVPPDDASAVKGGLTCATGKHIKTGIITC